MSRQLAFASRIVEVPYNDEDVDAAKESMRDELVTAGLTVEEIAERGKWRQDNDDDGRLCLVLAIWVG